MGSSESKPYIQTYKGCVIYYKDETTNVVYLGRLGYAYIRNEDNPKGYFLIPSNLPNDIHEKIYNICVSRGDVYIEHDSKGNVYKIGSFHPITGKLMSLINLEDYTTDKLGG